MNMVVSAAIAGTAIPLAPEVHDPIFAAIEAHKTAHAEWLASIDRHLDLEAELPRDKRRSFITLWEEEIVETDDPRWIEAERKSRRLSRAESEAACALLDAPPKTMAGISALLRHAIDYDTDGQGWPEELNSGDERNISRSWHQFLIENLLAALSEIRPS